jgi:interleukin-1 receptor-associated kinase 1
VFLSLGKERELVDPSLRDEPRISEILRCIQIAVLCVQSDPEDRPTMSDVLMMLKCDSMAVPVPREYKLPADGSEAEGSTSHRSA